MKKLFAKIMLKILRRKEVVDPYPPQGENEPYSEYNNRVPLIHQPTVPQPSLDYRGRPRNF